MHAQRIPLLIVSTFLLAANSLPAALSEEFAGKVVGVSDGDTITVLVGNDQRKIRLNGIDCPEKAQAFGQQAKAFTSKNAFQKNVTVISQGHDRYKRTIGEVILPNGESLNNLILENGYGWWYQQYSKDQHKHSLEIGARHSKIGLWSQDAANAPWDFRSAKLRHKS